DLYTQAGFGKSPRVAILSAVETVTSKIPSTIEAAALCKMADRGQITGGVLDGPLAFDNAIDVEVARIKGIKSEVAGRAQILLVNAGSSSVKFQVLSVEGEGKLRRLIKGQIGGIGNRPRLRANGADSDPLADRVYPIESVSDIPAAIRIASEWLRDEVRITPMAVGHRVVHGGPDYDRPVLIDHGVVARLERFVALAPLHQPHNLTPIRSLLTNFPTLPQVACFDTAFHRTHDAVADYYAIPHELHAEGVRRYGFHGLSYEYVAKTLPHVAP